ncbi:MAG: hypothetical protein ACRBM6_33960 [Geminicoccales bacterium]
MHHPCEDLMKTARDLLDHGVLKEGAETLVQLHDCGRRAGCNHWRQCIRLIEDQWQAAAAAPSLTQAPRQF